MRDVQYIQLFSGVSIGKNAGGAVHKELPLPGREKRKGVAEFLVCIAGEILVSLHASTHTHAPNPRSLPPVNGGEGKPGIHEW